MYVNRCATSNAKLKSNSSIGNDEFVIINNWFIFNRLSHNLNKSSFIIFHSFKKSISFDSPLSINNVLLNRVTQIRYLDILIDEFI